ncbi:MAG: GNAT family N-acetyltransferase [Proteobacteria bacterium]|nr:GNAT family N-acetyltransferase [Pseudomonadota bacterium]
MRDPAALIILPGDQGQICFRLLPHDTAAFGLPCYGYAPDADPSSPVTEFAQLQTSAFLTMKIAAEDRQRWAVFLTAHHFAFVDTELRLTGSVRASNGGLAGDIAFSWDPALTSCLDGALFVDLPSRFSMDPNLDKDRVAGFWRQYLEDMLRIPGHRVLFPVVAGNPVGVCLFHEQAGRLDIQLIALDAAHRGGGIATSLLGHAAQEWGSREFGTEVYAGARRACNFYLRNGLSRVEQVSHVFHCWTKGRTQGGLIGNNL